MSTLLERVKAKYQELYLAKYGRLDDSVTGQFLLWEAAIRFTTSKEYDGSLVHAVKRDTDPQDLFAIGFKSVSDIERQFERLYPGVPYQIRLASLPGMKGYRGRQLTYAKFDEVRLD